MSFGSAFGDAHPNEIATNSHANMPPMTTQRTASARTRSEHHAPTVYSAMKSVKLTRKTSGTWSSCVAANATADTRATDIGNRRRNAIGAAFATIISAETHHSAWSSPYVPADPYRNVVTASPPASTTASTVSCRYSCRPTGSRDHSAVVPMQETLLGALDQE
ncbi:hypothetical protein WDV91_15355 [Curtobacterium flaccumfaciens pv. flaccumfaciens]